MLLGDLLGLLVGKTVLGLWENCLDENLDGENFYFLGCIIGRLVGSFCSLDIQVDRC